MSFKVVYGPPCSGKSTYVKENKGESDVLFDYDRIFSAMTYATEHTKSEREYGHRFVMDCRSAFVRTAKKGEHGAQDVWFIISNLTDKVRGWLESLSPEYIRMEATEEECLARLENDDTRPDKEHQAEVIKQWFKDHAEKDETEESEKEERCRRLRLKAQIALYAPYKIGNGDK